MYIVSLCIYIYIYIYIIKLIFTLALYNVRFPRTSQRAFVLVSIEIYLSQGNTTRLQDVVDKILGYIAQFK